jgi:hypothetical protein
MAKQTVLGLVLERMDRFEAKLDKLLTETVPNIEKKVVREATTSSNTRSMIWGGITLVISLAGLAVAFYK